jgi:LysR family transcriptional regulator, glycine cleavage system transcriptional activator
MSEKKSQIARTLPSLRGLHVFEVAARHLSFVKAGDELCVSHGAVSRQIRQLEETLGLALFERRNRAVHLTADGHHLYEACTRALAAISHAVQKLRSPEVNLPLVVSCEPTIAIRWLIPRLPSYREQFPSQQIHLLTAGGAVDFVKDRVDLALRRNDFPWAQECVVERIGPELMGPVCQPKAAQALELDKPKTSMRQLHSRTRANGWSVWSAAAKQRLAFDSSEYFEHFYLSLQAASSGLGMALGSIYMVEDDIRDKRLVAPFGFLPDGSDYVLLSPVSFEQDKRRLVFLDWLRYQMRLSREYFEASVL